MTTGQAPLAVHFTDQSTNSPTSWAWTFGDGTTATTQSPIHTYAAAGTYDVSLTATNAGGPGSLTKTGYIVVSAAPPPTGYSATVLSDSPLSYWRLGETSGTVLADSAGTNPGTAKGGVTLNQPSALASDPNPAIGVVTNGYVEVKNAASLNFAGDFSIEAWAKPTVVNGVGGAIVHKGGPTGNSVWQYRLSLTSSNQWRGTVYVGATAFTVTSPAVATTAWTYLVLTKSGSTLTIYVNGSAVASATATGTINTNAGVLAIGRTGASATDYFNGSIDEVAVYPAALTAARVTAHYAAAAAPPPPAPVAAFSADVTTGQAPLAVHFTDQSTNSPTSWAWSFGDGTTATTQSPIHTYAAAGTYDVSLTATNAGGPGSLTKTGYIVVAAAPPPPAPVAAFSADVTTGQAPLAVHFTDQSTNSPTSWAWSFGDGTTATTQSPIHTYAAAGTYDVSLTATNAGGPGSLTKTGYIVATVGPPPDENSTIGFQGLSYSNAPYPPTSDKPQSKLWVTGSTWWADMFDNSSSTWHIFRLDRPSETWVDTGTLIDDRDVTLADTLWDGTHLYVASHVVTVSTDAAPVASVPNNPARFYRFSYAPATQQWTLDPGFPATITTWSSESMTIDKDSTGTIWATWTQVSGSGSTATNSVYLNNTVGNDATWSTPYLVPVAGANPAPDDISAVVAYGGNKIGVMWSNQKDESMYWAVHIDGQAATQWKGSQAIKGHGVADDHINLKSVQSDANGRVWAALKTSFDDVGTGPSDPLMQLLVFRPATNDWLVSTFGTVGDCQTRPLVVLDSEHQTVHMFAVGPTASGCPYSGYAGTVYEKTAPMSNPVFGTGRGTRVLQNGSSSFINDLTTTKQDVTGTTGLIVLASDGNVHRYWHLDETLGAPPPAPVAAFTADITSGQAPVNVTFTDQSTNTPTSWAWTFGDGTTSALQSPVHMYTAGGTYTVKLTVYNAGGSGSMTKTGYITITTPPPSAYMLAVLADSPISYWRLGERTGTAIKDSTGTNGGTAKNGPTLGQTGAILSDPDTAIGFGTSKYVQVASAANLNFTGDFTVEAWAKPTAVAGTAGAVAFKGGKNNSGGQYRLGIIATNQWQARVYVGSTVIVATAPAAATTAWTHLVMTRAGTALTLYVNGSQVASATVTGTINATTSVFTIGRLGSNNSEYFNGSVDEVAVYAGALTAGRIAAHYSAATTPSP